MKKALAIVLAAVLAALSAACSGRVDTADRSTPIPQVTGEIGGEITVSCYDSLLYQSFLEEAAAQFEHLHPGTRVNIESFSTMPEIKTVEQDGMVLSVLEYTDDPQARTDYVNRVGTALMSGGGADVLAMDVLPIYRYAAAGQLEDLSAYMQADPHFDAADYNSKLFEALHFAGGLWLVPLDYQFGYFAYDTTLATESLARQLAAADSLTYGQLLELDGAKGMDEPLFFDDEKSLFQELLSERYSEFVDVQGGKAHFDDGAFASLLEAVSGYAEQGLIRESAGAHATAEDMLLEFAAGQNSDERSLFRNQTSYSLLSHYTRDLEDRMFAYTSGSGGNEGDDEIAAIRATADGNVPFTYTQAFSLNANSANKRTAWEFIKFLLGEQMQGSPALSGNLPVHNAARARRAEQSVSGELYGMEPEELSGATQTALMAYTAAVEEMSAHLDRFIVHDPVVDDMIDEEVAAYFDGEKSAAEAAATLQSRAQLYLSE